MAEIPRKGAWTVRLSAAEYAETFEIPDGQLKLLHLWSRKFPHRFSPELSTYPTVRFRATTSTSNYTETPAVELSALDYALDGDAELRGIEAHIAAAGAADDGAAQALAHAALADVDGYSAPARAQALLLGLGFTLEQTRAPVASFSGGWRMRLNLAQALMSRSDLLLLDEPTNHLDLDAIVWLEDWLHRYTGTLIVISHDREFLDSACN
ncbi:hypothetical protein DFQ30_002047, partial [Apophysomyces sp. BC1015]